MSGKAKRLAVSIAIALFVSVYWLTPTVADSAPNASALSAFEALRAAGSSGANITSLINQYNVLLQSQSAPDSAFVSLGQLAAIAQQNALAQNSFNMTLTIVLVPGVAAILALACEGLLQLRRRIERQRMLEMEILQE